MTNRPCLRGTRVLLRILFTLMLLCGQVTAWADLADIVARSKPAVVTLRVETRSGEISMGSGFFVRADGTMLTAYHVVEDMARGSVKLSDGRELPIQRIVSGDAEKDIAVLKVDGKNLKTLPLADSARIREGESIIALGTPLGEQMLALTVTRGIVSGIRDVPGKGRLIQTDAPIAPGNSGGPLVNSAGQAIGIISFKVRGEAFNFAVAINEAKPYLNGRVVAATPPPPRNARPTTPGFPGGNGGGNSLSAEAQQALQTGISLIRQERYESALPYLLRATQLAPNHADAWFLLGVALCGVDRLEDALRATLTAVRLNPRHAPAHASLVLLAVSAGEVDMAREAYNRLSRLDPDLASEVETILRQSSRRSQGNIWR